MAFVQIWDRSTQKPEEPPFQLSLEEVATRPGRDGRTELDITEQNVRDPDKKLVCCSKVRLKDQSRGLLLIFMPPGELSDRLHDSVATSSGIVGMLQDGARAED